MKNNIFILFFGLFPVMLPAQNNMNPYASKSGKITYTYEYGEMASTYTILFDDYGKKECMDISVFNGNNVEHTRTIMNPEGIFVINYDEKQIMKFPAESDEESLGEYNSSGNENLDFRDMVTSSEKKISLGTETLLGKPCQVFKFDESEGKKGKFWVWKGFVLKAEYLDENGEHTFLEAKEVTIDSPVNASEFELPSDFEVTDMSETIQQMKQLQQMYGVPDEDQE